MKIEIGGATTLLTVIFFVAKITGYIDWSYWWVFSPLWIPILAVAIFCVLAAIVSIAIAFFTR